MLVYDSAEFESFSKAQKAANGVAVDVKPHLPLKPFNLVSMTEEDIAEAEKASKSMNNMAATWENQIMASPHKGKFFSLIPFFIESKFTPKSYVLKMEFFPEANFLLLHTLTISGIQKVYMPVKEMIPITLYDYWAASWMCFMKQHQCLDLEMVYASQLTKEMFVFDKYGEWHDEGIFHEGLSMEKTFQETSWYDEFNVQSF